MIDISQSTRIVTWIITFLIFVYFFSYSLWAGNNLALLIDSPSIARYVSLDFWRLVFVFPNILVPIFTIYLIMCYNRVGRFFPYTFHCILCVVAIFFTTAWLVWSIVDFVQCPTTAYCVGDGIPVLGIDVAFLVANLLQVIMWVHNIVFLIYNVWLQFKVRSFLRIRYTVQRNPNRPPETTLSDGISFVTT